MPDSLVLSDSPAGHALPGHAEAFVCSWTDGGLDAAWVHVAGELDVATAPQLERTLRLPQLQALLVVLDLRELTVMDTSGVHAIVDASIRARRAGRRLVLLRGPPNVNRLLALTGSSDDVEIGDVDSVKPSVQARLEQALPS
jgi:anti-anti-sigma factor